jgi:hypothetical protein
MRATVALALVLSAAVAAAAAVTATRVFRAHRVPVEQPVPSINSKEWQDLWNPSEQQINLAGMYGPDADKYREKLAALAERGSAAGQTDPPSQRPVPDAELPNPQNVMDPDNIPKNPFLLVRTQAVQAPPGAPADQAKAPPNAAPNVQQNFYVFPARRR